MQFFLLVSMRYVDAILLGKRCDAILIPGKKTAWFKVKVGVHQGFVIECTACKA